MKIDDLLPKVHKLKIGRFCLTWQVAIEKKPLPVTVLSAGDYLSKRHAAIASLRGIDYVPPPTMQAVYRGDSWGGYERDRVRRDPEYAQALRDGMPRQFNNLD